MKHTSVFGILGLLLFATAANAATNSHAKMHLFQSAQGVMADGSDVQGSAVTLSRGDSVVWIRANTTRLPPGTYTTWWVVFNNPSACEGACDMADFPQNGGNPDVMASVLYATGGAVGSNGVGYFIAYLEEGVLPTPGSQHRFGPGLLDAESAEIHFVVKFHGPPASDPTLLEKQTTTIWGGCSGGPGQPPDPVEADQLFPCYDPQAAALPRPGDDDSGEPTQSEVRMRLDAIKLLLDRVAQRVGLRP
jgi:hypothetical protein